MYRLMIVEDEAIIRKGLVQKIDWTSLGFQVIQEAANGKAALKKLEEELPDVILTDVRMPIMDGLALMSEVCRRYPRIRLMVLSGYGDFRYAQHALQCGAVDYILKPTKDEDIAAAFQRLKKLMDAAASPDSAPEAALPAPGIEPTGKDPVIDCIKAYIEENYQNKITLESAARVVHMNASYLCTYFRKVTGDSFKDYLIRYRMQRARDLIENTDLKIAGIAAAVGYDDDRHFAKVFKAETGMNASQLRKGT